MTAPPGASIDRLAGAAQAAAGPQINTIGLTGGIGSGKSTAARALVALGAGLVDTDAIAHALTGPGGAAMPALRQRFGDEAAGADGALDRSRMRQRMVDDGDAKLALEAILHPMIGAEARRQAQAARAADARAVVLFDVPLLSASSHWRAECQRILVIDCSAETQVQRVMARSGWSEQQVLRVIALQATRAQRLALADAVVFNDGISPETLAAELGALWALWQLPARHLTGTGPL